jgi:NAD(P)-dependent dehydrogenase (short-subunit alcohol dehydrogenase family)
MSAHVASELLRPGLLERVSIVHAGAGRTGASGDSPGALVRAACVELGASVWVLEKTRAQVPAAGEEAIRPGEDAADEAVQRILAESGGIDMLVLDAGALFAAASAAGGAPGAGEEATGEGAVTRTALRSCLEQAWNVTRAVANLAFLASGRGGRVVYLAPAGDGGEHADAARAGLENLARTLSVEWARHAITAVTIAPGAATTERELAALTAYLASPAGAYFSGCLLDLRGAAP